MAEKGETVELDAKTPIGGEGTNLPSNQLALAHDREQARKSSSEKFVLVMQPAILGAILGVAGQLAIIKGYIDTPYAEETYLGGLLDLLVILALSLPAILINVLLQGPQSERKEMLNGGLLVLFFCSVFGLLFSYCLLPVTIMMWFYATMSWSTQELQDFRLGFWAGLSCIVGSLSGSVAISMFLA